MLLDLQNRCFPIIVAVRLNLVQCFWNNFSFIFDVSIYHRIDPGFLAVILLDDVFVHLLL